MIHIFVNVLSQSLPIHIDYNVKILHIKEYISDKLLIPINDMRLTYNHLVLNDDKLIKDYNFIKNKTRLSISVKKCKVI